jgi:hypothetical protein
MEMALWKAVQRLRWLVLVTLACAALPFALGSRINHFAAAAGGAAVAFLAASAVPMAVAARRMRGSASSDATAQLPLLPAYRQSARTRSNDYDLIDRSATRPAALAFVLLALSGALLIVTAAAR